MKAVLYLMKAGLQILYGLLKLFPAKENKILFLSRQTNGPGLDFRMIQAELRRQEKEERTQEAPEHPLQIVSICRRMEGGLSGYGAFAVCMLRSLYHLATSRVCVLDSYWPAVSMLNHKPSLFVLQIWHALGKIKQSGYQTLQRESGRDETVAEILGMHRNYDAIIAGGKAWNPFYCASFGVKEDVLINVGLPRIDYLLQTEVSQREKVYEAHPQLRGKKIILYAPTFRRYEVDGGRQLLDHLDTEHYIMILKAHPNQKLEYSGEGLYACEDFTAVELLSVCDHLITDYSAIAVEGAVLNRKTWYYVFDFDQYYESNGMNIDLFEEMPGCVFRDAGALMEALQSGDYNQDALDRYRKKYLPENPGTSTRAIVEIIRNQR